MRAKRIPVGVGHHDNVETAKMDHVLVNLLSKMHTQGAASFRSQPANPRDRIRSPKIAESIFRQCIFFPYNDFACLMWLEEDILVRPVFHGTFPKQKYVISLTDTMFSNMLNIHYCKAFLVNLYDCIQP